MAAIYRVSLISVLCMVSILVASKSSAETLQQFAKLTKCQLSSVPASLASSCVDLQAPAEAIPSLYNGTSETFEISMFGAPYIRISLPAGLSDGAVTSMFPIYAKIPAWNSDGTRLMLQSNNGFLHIFDGGNYTYIEELTNTLDMDYSGTDPEPRWSHTNPNVFYYVYKLQLRSYNIATHTTTTIHTFTDNEMGTQSAVMIHNGDEGNPDDTDRYWTWYVQNGAYTQIAVIVYDKKTDAVIAHNGFDSGGLCGESDCPTNTNWVGMSKSGNYVNINWNADASDGDFTTRGKGHESFDRELTYVAKISEKNWHNAITQLADGTDVFIGASHLNETNGYKAVRAVSLGDGSVKTSCMRPVSQFNHISGRSNVKSWVLYSTYDQTGAGLGTISPGGLFATEAFALNMDTCEVARVAHTQSYWIGTKYSSEPHATVNFDFTKIVWGSNWRDQDGVVHAYVAELRPQPSPGIRIK